MKKVKQKIEKENELGARRAVLEDLFYDFNKSRAQIYSTNFFRGIFFGFGSVIGGTVVIALMIWTLTWLTDIPGWFGDFIQFIVDSVQGATQQ